MRKILIPLVVVLAACGIARAAAVEAEPIPADFIQQFAPFAVQLIKQQFPNAPVKVDVAADKASGYHVQEMVGMVILPDKNLTEKTVGEAGEREVPVAVVATKSLSLTDKDTPVTGDRLAVADFNGMFKIPVFFLSVKGKGDDRTLLVYSKAGKPLVEAPLKKAAGADASQAFGVKLTHIDLEKKIMDADVSLGGGYQTTLKLAVIEP